MHADKGDHLFYHGRIVEVDRVRWDRVHVYFDLRDLKDGEVTQVTSDDREINTLHMTYLDDKNGVWTQSMLDNTFEVVREPDDHGVLRGSVYTPEVMSEHVNTLYPVDSKATAVWVANNSNSSEAERIKNPVKPSAPEVEAGTIVRFIPGRWVVQGWDRIEGTAEISHRGQVLSDVPTSFLEIVSRPVKPGQVYDVTYYDVDGEVESVSTVMVVGADGSEFEVVDENGDHVRYDLREVGFSDWKRIR